MANPEDVEIVRLGREALDAYWEHDAPPAPEVTLDLKGADLKGICLIDGSLDRADLSGANLEKANLLSTSFESSLLTGANLEKANLRGAYFVSALLTGANLKKAHLFSACLDCTNMDGVNLDSANCGGAKLRLSSLKNATLRNAYLSGADFERSDLSGADLTGADLTSTGFCDAKLEGTILDGMKFHLTVTERWIIKNVRCTHFFLLSPETFDEGSMWKRIPQKGFLAPGEFKDRLMLVNKEDAWITVTEAANFLAVHRGVISRWATEGKIKDNEEVRVKRRVLLSSVLLIKHKQEQNELRKDARDLRKDGRRLPEIH